MKPKKYNQKVAERQALSFICSFFLRKYLDKT
jgi:hypothetical protein